MFAFNTDQHFCRWPIFSTHSTPCLTVSLTSTTFSRLSLQTLISWKGRHTISFVWFAGRQSEWHTYDCIGGAREEWGQARPRFLLGFSEIAFTFTFTGSWYLRDCFHFHFTVSWFLRDCYNGVGSVEHLLRTSNSRQKPTDWSNSGSSVLLRSSSSLSESWNFLIFSFEPASIQAP